MSYAQVRQLLIRFPLLSLHHTVGQSVHAEDASAPLAAENFPVEHSLQLREEGESEYSPGEQSAHADASSPVAAFVRCFPELQPMHALLEAPLY